MRKKNVIIFVLFFLNFNLTIARADYVVDFYEINKKIPGLIQIRTGTFRGKENHETLNKNPSLLNDSGIILADEKTPSTVEDKTKLGTYDILTKLTVIKPKGTGFGGVNWTANIDISINGKRKLALPLGYVAGKITVKEITISYDGWIDVLAFDESGKILEIPFKARKFGNMKNKSSEFVLIDDTILKIKNN